MRHEKGVEILLRIGLAFAFLYPPIAAYFDPLAWIGYFPQFLLDIAGTGDIFILHTFGAIEILIALWLLWGKYLFYPSVAAAILLTGIILFNFPQMDVLFRDVSILTMAVALAFSSYPKNSIQSI